MNKGCENRQRTLHKDITIINMHAPNIRALQYVRQLLTSMKGEVSSNTVILGDFNTPFAPVASSTKQNQQGTTTFK